MPGIREKVTLVGSEYASKVCSKSLSAWCELSALNLRGRCPRTRVGLPVPFPKGKEPSLMVDVDTFLTALYVMVDDFYNSRSPKQQRPGPDASLSTSELITLAIFARWSRFSSERDFYRYASGHLREAFPTLPDPHGGRLRQRPSLLHTQADTTQLPSCCDSNAEMARRRSRVTMRLIDATLGLAKRSTRKELWAGVRCSLLV
jgi:hypothetical protein